MALTGTWAHRWDCLGPSLVSGCGCPGSSFLFHHPKSACLSSLLSTTCIKYVFHAREQRWELALPATGARIQPEHGKQGTPSFSASLPNNSQVQELPKVIAEGRGQNLSAQMLDWVGCAYVRISFSLYSLLLSNDI